MTAVPPKPGQAMNIGTMVRVSTRKPEVHCRTPSYLRGASGVVDEVVGFYRDPSLLAFHKPGLPMRLLYRVRFRHRDIWPNYMGNAADSILADLYGDWLEPIQEQSNGQA